MKEYKEILLSFSVGLAVFWTWPQITKTFRNEDRIETRESPTVLQGRGEDDQLSLSWGLEAIRAREGWRMAKGNKDVVVAVIDTGCDIHHPALSENIWTNPGEDGLDENGNPKATNGRDDDGNGYVDDIHGWNFVNDSPDVTDDHGHGTHIAGIVGAKRLPGGGSSGVAPGVSLMILKYYDADSGGEGNLVNTIRAIRYATRMGARIINYSGGGILRSESEEAVLGMAAQKGVLFVAAAGNEGLNSDFFHFYPADYDLPNIISVGASDRTGKLMAVSNFGRSTVDIAAPGRNIHSTLPDGQYGFMSGTSQATAFVTGVAALILSQQGPLMKSDAVIQQIVSSRRALPSLRNRTVSGGILNAAQALETKTKPVAVGM
ncbi:MAG: S8 family peptidase [Bdellovibrionales bacterium]